MADIVGLMLCVLVCVGLILVIGVGVAGESHDLSSIMQKLSEPRVWAPTTELLA